MRKKFCVLIFDEKGDLLKEKYFLTKTFRNIYLHFYKKNKTMRIKED